MTSALVCCVLIAVTSVMVRGSSLTEDDSIAYDWGPIKDRIETFCGRDENGTVVRPPVMDFCEAPSNFFTSYDTYDGPPRGTIYGVIPDIGTKRHVAGYSQLDIVPFGYACDGVLFLSSMFMIRRPDDSMSIYTAEWMEDYGVYGFGYYRPYSPESFGIRCMVEPLFDVDVYANEDQDRYERQMTVWPVTHGTIHSCTMCYHRTPFDCPYEVDQWYFDGNLVYRDGNICKMVYGDSGPWFPYVYYYYDPGILIQIAYHGQVAELGRDHPLAPEAGLCLLNTSLPVYPDSILGGQNPAWTLPVTLNGYPYHYRKLAQTISGDCDEVTVQAVFKLSADDSWSTNTSVEYGRINQTETIDLNDLRTNVLTPGIYLPEGEDPEAPLLAKMSGLLHGTLLVPQNVSLTRCLIDPNLDFPTEEQQYANGSPVNCVACTQVVDGKTFCATPQVGPNGTWILDTFTGPNNMLAYLTVPPGYTVTLAAFNATEDDPPSFPDALNSTDLPDNNTNWKPFSHPFHSSAGFD